MTKMHPSIKTHRDYKYFFLKKLVLRQNAAFVG